MTGVLAVLVAAAQGDLDVSVSPPSSDAGGTTGPFSCPAVTAHVSGGTGIYTYAWTEVSSTYPLTISAPTSATTAFTFAGVDFDTTAEAVARVTATETATGRTATLDVSVTYTRFGGFA